MNPRSKSPAQSPTESTDQIRHQLERILESPQFKNSRRCSDFLRHVVEGATGGRAELLKERTLGVAVFDREPDYDTNQDPIVRNTAGQVRKRLAQYYIQPEHDRELRIDLPPGSYVPEIQPPDRTPVASTLAPAESAASATKSRKPLFWGIGAVLAAIAVIATVQLGRNRPAVFEQFWAPVLRYPGEVVLCVGQGHTYKLTPELDRFFEGRGTPAFVKNGAVPLTEIVPAWDRYVALSDTRTAMRFAVLFANAGKQFALRGGRNTSLADLRGKPVVLVGAFNNDWTLSLTGELRFYFENDPERKVEILRDRLHPDNRSWQVRTDESGLQIQTDYAIVSRVSDPTTEQSIIVAAGIRGGGTSAAGEFLTNPDYLAQALRDAPAGWQKKNVQFVLSTRMFSGNPGPPAVVATHYW